MQAVHYGDWSNRGSNRAHALVECVFNLVSGDNRPVSSVVQHNLFCRSALTSRPWLRCVGEGEPCCVYNAIIPDQRHGNLCWLSHPLPSSSELPNLRHDAQHAFLTPVHSLSLYISKPDTKVRCETLSSQLKHSNVTTTVDMQAVHYGDWSNRGSNRAHALVECVFNLVSGDNRPVSSVVQHLLVGLFRTGGSLKLNDPLLG